MFFTNLGQLGYCRLEFRAPNLHTSVLLAEDVVKGYKALVLRFIWSRRLCFGRRRYDRF
jgi:hypothetical protein